MDWIDGGTGQVQIMGSCAYCDELTGSTNLGLFSVDKKNQLDVTFCILYFSSTSCSTRFGQPCAHHQELTTA